VTLSPQKILKSIFEQKNIWRKTCESGEMPLLGLAICSFMRGKSEGLKLMWLMPFGQSSKFLWQVD